jgi:methionine-rich copper-binding protein CopC
MQMTEKAYEGTKKVIGSSPWYKAYEGVNTALNQVYWIEIISETPEGLLITNPSLPGQKKTVKTVKKVVEKELVYPLVRGRDVKRWYIIGDYGWIIVPHDFRTGKPIQENIMKLNFPRTYSYFSNFEKELENRSIHKLWGKGNPFYSVYDIGDYTFYPYKVVWKYVAGKISGKAEFSTAVLEPVEDKLLGIKTVIPNEKLMLIPFLNRDEAYYVSAILNSSLSQLLVASYVIETAISTHILERIKILKFNPNSSSHLKLSELSKKAHEIAKRIYEEGREDLKEELSRVEEEIDKTVAHLYGITNEELEEIRKCLAILKEGEIYEEEEGEEEITLPKEENLKIAVEPLLVNENEPKELLVRISNHLNENIEGGRIKVKLKDETLADQKLEGIRRNEEKILKFMLPKLKAGQYNLEIVFTFKVDEETKVVKEVRRLFVKSVSKRTTKTSFEGLDELLGG